MGQVRYQHQPAGEMLSPERAAAVHETALRILAEVGLAVGSAPAREALARRGFRVAGERVHVEPRVVEDYLAARRARESEQPPPPTPRDDGRLYLATGAYAHHVHDLEADAIVPYSSDALVEMTKLVDVLADEGVYSAAPGYPLDVAPPLQPVAQYRIGALYCRQGTRPVDPISSQATPWVMEMADALGQPLRSLPVYVFSPLRLAGESLETVLALRHRLAGVHVSSMPSLGGTAPVLPFGALALAVAEVLGAATVLAEITDLPVDFGLGLFAFDLRHGTMVFGSPEAYLLGQLSAQIAAFYSPWRAQSLGNASAGIHVRANFPDAQAAAEKASLMTAGALVGARVFAGAGIVSLDEVFSAEQLLVDLEIRDGVARLLAGLDLDDAGLDWVAEIARGVQGAFLTLDSTLDHYREVYWHPRLFDRGFAPGDGYRGRAALAQRARERARALIARHAYALPAEQQRDLDAIWRRAQQALG